MPFTKKDKFGQFDNMDDASPKNVTSAELVRSFAKWREISLTRPVHITTHGRVSHVLTGARLYQQFVESSDSESELIGDARLTGLSEWLKDGLILCNANEEIIYANQRVNHYLGLEAIRIGARLTDIIPELEGSVMQAQYRRTLETREALTADMPTQRRKGRWVNFQSIPLGDRLVLLFRDITDEVERYRLADVKAAMLDAIGRHKDVSYVRLSRRGLIDMTDSSFEVWVGIAREKLMGIRLHDIIIREDRYSFRNALDKVLGENQASTQDFHLMPNKNEPLSVHCSMVPLRGAYGSEGATLIMTRC